MEQFSSLTPRKSEHEEFLYNSENYIATTGYYLQHLIIDMNTSRVIVVLISEIRRNGPPRSLVFALSRLLDALKYVKINRSRLAKNF